MDVTFVLTHDCNLGCSYCYAGRKFRKSMSREVRDQALDLAFGDVAAGTKMSLCYFGGEPTLEWDLLVETAAKARQLAEERGVLLVQSVTTNGTTRNRFAQNCTGTCALDFAAGQVAEVTLTGNITTVTVANVRDGENYSIIFKQNGTGGRTIANLGSNIHVGPGGWFSGTNSTAPNLKDLFLCTAFGSTLNCMYTLDVKQ